MCGLLYPSEGLMAYERAWGGSHPGCLIFLLDQSGSMADKFGDKRVGGGRHKKDMVATVLNSFLHELVETNTVGTQVRPRAEVAVLGYGGDGVRSALSGHLAIKRFVTLPDLKNNPLRVSVRTRKEIDDTGNIIEQSIFFPEWVEASATGGTPMCQALVEAYQLAEEWAVAHPLNYPPVVINVTDGQATDGDITAPAAQLAGVSTNDGAALLFNCHITTLSSPAVSFPASEGEVPSDQYARQLFRVSSAIPDTARRAILAATGRELPSGSRGFIFHGDAESIKLMFTFASIARTVPLADLRG
jgi:hypothetical protein